MTFSLISLNATNVQLTYVTFLNIHYMMLLIPGIEDKSSHCPVHWWRAPWPCAPEYAMRMPGLLLEMLIWECISLKRTAALKIVLQEASITVIIDFIEKTGPFNTFQERGKGTHKLQTLGTFEIGYSRQVTLMDWEKGRYRNTWHLWAVTE